MAPGVGRIDEHNVEVTDESAVLEAVVEQQDLSLVFGDGGAGGGDAVGPLDVRHTGEVVAQDHRLVVELREVAAVEGAAVAAAEDGDADVPLGEPPGQVFDEGGLAGAADGEVADADDGDAGLERREVA